jgi:5-formyltetrahydrofolate cyclo-ligase
MQELSNKQDLRIKAKNIRNSLLIDKISNDIIKNILNLEFYQKAKNIMIFYPLLQEINLLPLLDSDKFFFLPKVEEENLLVCPYKKGDELKISAFNTKEPSTTPVNPDILDIIFVPALMIDKNLNRLGYGGGFYDRFLDKNAKNAKKIAAIPNKLFIEEIPCENFDIKMDIVVTEIKH